MRNEKAVPIVQHYSAGMAAGMVSQLAMAVGHPRELADRLACNKICAEASG